MISATDLGTFGHVRNSETSRAGAKQPGVGETAAPLETSAKAVATSGDDIDDADEEVSSDISENSEIFHVEVVHAESSHTTEDEELAIVESTVPAYETSRFYLSTVVLEQRIRATPTCTAVLVYLCYSADSKGAGGAATFFQSGVGVWRGCFRYIYKRSAATKRCSGFQQTLGSSQNTSTITWTLSPIAQQLCISRSRSMCL